MRCTGVSTAIVRQDALLLQVHDDLFDGLFECQCGRLNMNFWRFRRLIGTVDTGEIHQLSSTSLFVQAFDITCLSYGQWGIDKHLDEFARVHELARHLPLSPERRNEGGQDDQTSIDEKFGHFGHAANILYPVGISKAEIAVQPVADIVTVE